MAKFVSDQNHWYQITLGSSGNSMDGTPLYTADKHGAVFMQGTNTSDSEEIWQVYPYDSTYFVLRTIASGPTGYLASLDDGIIPVMVEASQADESIFWQLNPWGDDVYYFTNAKNSSSWVLNVQSDNLMNMTSYVSPPQDTQKFSFFQLGTIDDARFSSVVLPPALSTSSSSSSTATPASSPVTPSSTSNSSVAQPTSTLKPHNGLSTSTKTDVGASVGVVAFLALIAVAAIILVRRRRRRISEPNPHSIHGGEPSGGEMKKRELQVAELHDQNYPAELPERKNSLAELPAHGSR